MAVDYDDQPPKLAEEEDPRQPDAAYVAHDREMRDNARLEHEIRGSGHHDRATETRSSIERMK
jgi:hypothetical protein